MFISNIMTRQQLTSFKFVDTNLQGRITITYLNHVNSSVGLECTLSPSMIPLCCQYFGSGMKGRHIIQLSPFFASILGRWSLLCCSVEDGCYANQIIWNNLRYRWTLRWFFVCKHLFENSTSKGIIIYYYNEWVYVYRRAVITKLVRFTKKK